jgi:uncharacterized protein YlxW (UPF0749 family)
MEIGSPLNAVRVGRVATLRGLATFSPLKTSGRDAPFPGHWAGVGSVVGVPDQPPRAAHDRRRRLTWRLVTTAIFAAAGLMMVTSAVSSGGTDLRAGRYSDLSDLARDENTRLQDLRADVAALNADITRLSDQVHNPAYTHLEKQVRALQAPAGLDPVSGPGVQVTLQDAPESVRQQAGNQVANAIVHQQDIQAVVNALWAGHAQAVTLQGQRVVSTTGIKCVGNTVLLHGVTYSPPYVVSAVGNPTHLRRALLGSAYVQAYLQAVDQYQLGWDLRSKPRVDSPAYDGSLEMRYAKPASSG